MAKDLVLTREDIKSIGALEKGVSVLEAEIKDMHKSQTDHNYRMISMFEDMRKEMMSEMRRIESDLDKKTNELHTQIDNVIADGTKMKLSVQKLATTVSFVVGVGLYIVKGVFDAAKEHIAGAFFS